jgi:hypothetical protein
MSNVTITKLDHGRNFIQADGAVINQYQTLTDAYKQVAANHKAGRLAARYTGALGYMRGDSAEWVGSIEAFPDNPYFEGMEDVKGRHFSNWLIGAERFGQFQKVISDKITPPVSQRRRVRFNEFDGSELDYDRLRAGQEFWRSTRRKAKRAPKTVALFIQVGQLAMRHWSESIWRIAAGVATTVALEKSGYRVELWAVYTTTNQRTKVKHDGPRSHYTTHGVCLKRCNEALDVNTAVNVCSGWSHRTLFFALASCYSFELTKTIGRCNSTMGATTTPYDADLDLLTKIENKFVFTDVHDEDSAIDQAKEIIEEINQLGGGHRRR